MVKFVVLLLLGALLSPCHGGTSKAAKAPKAAPVVIVRDTGGFAGPDFDFMVWPDRSWRFNRHSEPSRKGTLTKAQFAQLVDRLAKSGIDKAVGIQPSPKLHSQLWLVTGKKNTKLFLERTDPIMKAARTHVRTLIKLGN